MIFNSLTKDMIYFQKNKGFPIATCRNCKREVEAKKRQCPYCGILNPTVTLKDIFVTLTAVVVVMAVLVYGFGLGQ